MVIQDDAWQIILERGLAPHEIQEIAAQGLGVPEYRWHFHENGVSRSDVQFYLDMRARSLSPAQRLEIWRARRRLYGFTPVYPPDTGPLAAGSDDRMRGRGSTSVM